MFMRRRIVLFLVLGTVCSMGCADWTRNRQLEKVAKDWCMTLRASQVIPVYPMTEDLQPGDVFLVTTPVAKQADEYNKNGFLAFDQFVTRLKDIDYNTFYKKGYWDAAYAPPPTGHPRVNTPWMSERKPQTPAPAEGRSAAAGAEGTTAPAGTNPPANGQATAATTGGTAAGSGNDSTARKTLAGVEAPRAAFPTYTVKVKINEGLNLALPIHGVPFAMSIMNADSANVSVSLADAYTYSCAREELLQQFQDWWDGKSRAQQEVLTLAKEYAKEWSEKNPEWWPFKSKEPVLYLRVVSRVYLVGAVTTEISRADAFAFAADIRSIQPPGLPKIDAATFETDYTGILNGLSQPFNPSPKKEASGGTSAKSEAQPGAATKEEQEPATKEDDKAKASFRFAYATSRSVGMAQEFDRPIVIGYLGIDVPIMKDGTLGLPIDTHCLLEHPTQFGKPLNANLLTTAKQNCANDIKKLRFEASAARQAAWAEQVALSLSKSESPALDEKLRGRFTCCADDATQARSEKPLPHGKVQKIIGDLAGALLLYQSTGDEAAAEIHEAFKQAFLLTKVMEK
jgi:hypothetical protein